MVGGSRVVNLARRGEKEPLLETRGIFFLCFDGVISTCRNVFPTTFLHKEKLKNPIAAGDPEKSEGKSFQANREICNSVAKDLKFKS